MTVIYTKTPSKPKRQKSPPCSTKNTPQTDPLPGETDLPGGEEDVGVDPGCLGIPHQPPPPPRPAPDGRAGGAESHPLTQAGWGWGKPTRDWGRGVGKDRGGPGLDGKEKVGVHPLPSLPWEKILRGDGYGGRGVWDPPSQGGVHLLPCLSWKKSRGGKGVDNPPPTTPGVRKHSQTSLGRAQPRVGVGGGGKAGSGGEGVGSSQAVRTEYLGLEGDRRRDHRVLPRPRGGRWATSETRERKKWTYLGSQKLFRNPQLISFQPTKLRGMVA